ncbi:GNAT family N-acetyltransferase [soil metagenome]
MNPQSVTLAGPFVRLEPLTLDHVPALARVGCDPSIWNWIPTPVPDADAMHAWVALALADQARGLALPFAIIDVASGELIGSSRYGNIDRANRRVEIGWTWLAVAHQRTTANTSAKRLLLGHAFDDLGALRVELKTDALNDQSRKAIARIGATQEGISRKHLVTASGRVRDTVYFSIIRSEWPEVRCKLDARLARSDLAASSAASSPVPAALHPTS